MALTQENRFAKVFTPLDENALLLARFSAEETLSGLYRFDLDLAAPHKNGTEPAEIPFDEIIGQPMTVQLGSGEEESRWFHGIVSRLRRGHADEDATWYQAEVVPWMWLLTLNRRCRIFEGQTIAGIAKEVFTGIAEGDVIWAGESGGGETRLHTVQYRETDYDFVARLLEQEGTFWWFQHDNGKVELHLAESTSQATALPKLAGSLVHGPTPDAPIHSGNRVTDWNKSQELISGSHFLRDWNYHDPGALADAEGKAKIDIGKNSRFVRQDYPGEFVKRGEETAAKQDFGDAWATLRMREEEAASIVCSGESACAALGAGTLFTLESHPSDSGEYLVTSVRHECFQPLGSKAAGGSDMTYRNSFTCIPSEIPFVPRRTTPRPEIRGPQTAIVVSDEEKDAGKPAIDSIGRVKVNFHWNYGKGTTDESSCWVRVSQGWAGSGWGAQFHPRVGHEVIVEFLEGDPDRPIITGRVYNGANLPPYPKPTQTGIKTRTLDGSTDNFNEIRFTDEKGAEELFFQAEKDQTILVKNNRTQTVGYDRSSTIDHDETLSVANDRSVSVGNNHTDSVGSNQTLSVGAKRARTVGASESVSIAANRTRTVGVNDAITVGAAQEITVGGAQTVTVGGVQETTVGAKQSVSVGAEQSIEIGANREMKIGGELSEDVGKDWKHKTGKKITVEAGDEITLKAGKAKIVMKKNGDITIEGKKILVKGSGDVVLKGKKITEN